MVSLRRIQDYLLTEDVHQQNVCFVTEAGKLSSAGLGGELEQKHS